MTGERLVVWSELRPARSGGGCSCWKRAFPVITSLELFCVFFFSLLAAVSRALLSTYVIFFFSLALCFAHAAVSVCLQHAGQLAKGVSTVAKGKKVAE